MNIRENQKKKRLHLEESKRSYYEEKRRQNKNAYLTPKERDEIWDTFKEIERKIRKEIYGALKKEVSKMITYRRKNGAYAWHWCTNCSDWPTSDYEEVTLPEGERPNGDLHNECRSKEREGTCKTKE